MATSPLACGQDSQNDEVGAIAYDIYTAGMNVRQRSSKALRVDVPSVDELGDAELGRDATDEAKAEAEANGGQISSDAEAYTYEVEGETGKAMVAVLAVAGRVGDIASEKFDVDFADFSLDGVHRLSGKLNYEALSLSESTQAAVLRVAGELEIEGYPSNHLSADLQIAVQETADKVLMTLDGSAILDGVEMEFDHAQVTFPAAGVGLSGAR
ncbi:MAG: hypothetical protein H6729_05495 [Deltaproteobacteria bacterium]|nr:hypothetical protein [Deltaproteobacteria bacterium]